MPKPKVSIDEDGDGDTDVTVEIDTPPDSPPSPDYVGENVRVALAALVAKMEAVLPSGTQRITYAGAREVIRGIIT